MKVLCAWCIQDGRTAFMREKAPLDDLRETHSLCGAHFLSLSQSVGARLDATTWRGWMRDIRDALPRWGQRVMGRWLSLG